MPVIFEPYNAQLTGLASVFVVVKYDRTASGDDRFTVMPNVKCLTLHFQEGTVVPSGQFEYVLDSTDPSSPFPITIGELWPTSATGPYVLEQDDEILVFEYTETGDRYLVFDGFVQFPQVDMGGGLHVHFTATGVHTRLWDTPVGGATYRNSEDPQNGTTVDTGLPTSFNSGGKPNCTPVGYDENEGSGDARPVFLDEKLPVPSGTTPVAPRMWLLPGFVRYLMWNYNGPETWVKNPFSSDATQLDAYLKSVTPAAGDYMDLNDSSTYTTADITLRSFDATNKPWIEAVVEQLKYHGFRVYFNTREDPGDPGAPINEIIIFRVDGRDGNAPKDLYYTAFGGDLTDGIPSYSGFNITRDSFDAANEFEVETAEAQYECSLVLAPNFSIAAADATSANVPNYDIKNLSTALTSARKAYREWVFDEAGIGHWSYGSSSFVTGTATSLDSVLGASSGGVPAYVHRLRRCLNTLFSLDDDGLPPKAELAFSRNYAGTVPGVWDGTGSWLPLADSGWGLMPDRIGIKLTCDNPENFKIPNGNSSFPGETLAVIKSLAVNTAPNTRFHVRLTTVIGADTGAVAVAAKRDASPMRYTVKRRLESKDHWKVQIVHSSSVNNAGGTSGTSYAHRDDTALALAHARSLRSSHEYPETAGALTIPWISHAIGVGDFLGKITGLDINLDRGAAAGAGESPHYPVVVGFSYNCQQPQSTTFRVNDRRAEPEAINHGFGK